MWTPHAPAEDPTRAGGAVNRRMESRQRLSCRESVQGKAPPPPPPHGLRPAVTSGSGEGEEQGTEAEVV